MKQAQENNASARRSNATPALSRGTSKRMQQEEKQEMHMLFRTVCFSWARARFRTSCFSWAWARRSLFLHSRRARLRSDFFLATSTKVAPKLGGWERQSKAPTPMVVTAVVMVSWPTQLNSCCDAVAAVEGLAADASEAIG